MSGREERDYTNDASGLPRGWRTLTLTEIAGETGFVNDGDWVESKDQDPEGDVRLTQLADVGDGWFRDRSNRWMNDEAATRLRCTYLKPGDVLIARMPDPLGRACVFPPRRERCVTVVDVCIVRAPSVEPGWLAHFINAPATRAEIASYQSGSTRKRISRKNLCRIGIPVPPLPEQRRIVAEIDKHFTRLDSAVATLERVRANLQRARASVLKAAVEGRLVPTEASVARAEGRTYETGSALLQRVLEARRAAWDEAQAGASRKRKYKEPAEPETEGLPELPEGWCWATLDSLADVRGGITKNKRLTGGREVPYLRVANVQRGRLALEHVKTINAPEDKIEALRLEPGDILLNEGGDRDKLGRGWIWEGQIPECIHQNHVFRARVWSTAVLPKFVSHYANSVGQSYFVGAGKQTTNLASISLTNMRRLPVPVPPLAEQARIVAELDQRLSVFEAIDATVETSHMRCARLRQAILKRAFEGRLVEPEAEADAPLLAAEPSP